MHIRAVRKGLWDVYEVCNHDGSSPLLEWCNTHGAKYAGSIRRLFAIFRQAAETPCGPTQFPDTISHEVNKEEKIFEFLAGDIRIFWFYSEYHKKLIVCSCQHLKKSKKASKLQVSRIIKIKKDFAEAVRARKIVYFDDEGRS